MNLYLKRRSVTPVYTDGVLTDESGLPLGDTSELTPKCLPEGSYRIRFGTPRMSDARLPMIGYRRAFIWKRNGVHGNGASINLGKRLVPGVVVRTQRPVTRLVKRLEKVFQRGEECRLVISHEGKT